MKGKVKQAKKSPAKKTMKATVTKKAKRVIASSVVSKKAIAKKATSVNGQEADLLKRQPSSFVEGLLLPQRVVLQIADEVAKRLRRKPTEKKSTPAQKIENPIFLDTSAIIDGRVFDLIKLGVFIGTFVVLDGVLSELKNIADAKDDVKKERGRKGLKMLDDIKKQKHAKVMTLKDASVDMAVDDRIVSSAKDYKARIITCDYNLSKKARISGVVSIDMYELANILKTNAIPGEVFWIKIIQKGKGESQGVGYLPDGTMIVVEKGEEHIGKTIQVLVSRIIQTEAGKIFFSKLLDSDR